MHITAQGPRLRNDLYCVKWDIKLYYTIPYTVSHQQDSFGKIDLLNSNWKLCWSYCTHWQLLVSISCTASVCVSFKRVFDVQTKQDEVFDVVARPVIDKLVTFFCISLQPFFVLIAAMNVNNNNNNNSSNCSSFPSVLWHCWLSDRKASGLLKNWMLVCWWWWYDLSFAHLIAPVVTTTSIILSSNKIQNGDIMVPANPVPPGNGH